MGGTGGARSSGTACAADTDTGDLAELTELREWACEDATAHDALPLLAVSPSPRMNRLPCTSP